MRQIVRFTILILIAGLGIYTCAGQSAFIPGQVSVYLLLMIFPGAAFYLLAQPNPRLLEFVLASTVVSPVLAGLAAVILMVLGISARTAVVAIASASVVFAAAPSLARGLSRTGENVSGKRLLVLAGVVFTFCVIAGYLPFTNEWWRVRSDAWFHAAVISQINDYGIPPEDPYFYGTPLQYMWFYHVLVLVLSRGLNLHPNLVMPLLNIQAIIGFIVATFLVSVFFKKRFFHGLSSVLTAVLGISALFWLFLPIKLIRVFTGEVTGMDEVSRLLALDPLNMYTVRDFIHVGHNQVFFLDKFIVMTPFSLGLAFMASAWYGVVRGLRGGGAFPVALTFIAFVGMLAFHTVVGIIMSLVFGSALVLLFWKSRGDGRAGKKTLVLLGALVAGAVVLSPYLYAVLHGKDSSQMLPFGLSLLRTMGIVISCALGFILAAFQVKKLAVEREPAARFFGFAALFVVVYCLIIVLPGPNMFDKPPFFVFYPLAVAGGWTLAELADGGRRFWGKKTVVILLFIVLFLPVNLLATLGYFKTAPKVTVNQWEWDVTEWARSNTTRDAVFIDSGKHVFLAVTGPRRYYYGRDSYADMWGYNSEEINRRRQAKSNLYSGSPIEASTFAALSAVLPDLYIITREDENEAAYIEQTARFPDRLEKVFSSGPISVYKVHKIAQVKPN